MDQAKEVIYVCRKGNDSLVAARKLRSIIKESGKEVRVRDLRGGLEGWSRDVDPNFPMY